MGKTPIAIHHRRLRQYHQLQAAVANVWLKAAAIARAITVRPVAPKTTRIADTKMFRDNVTPVFTSIIAGIDTALWILLVKIANTTRRIATRIAPFMFANN